MKTVAGFTLIELLVVLMITGVAISLVGPVSLQQFDRVQAVRDRERLYRVLEHTQFESFVQRETGELAFSGRSVYLLRHQEEVASWVFEHLSFPQQVLQVNAHGFWQQQELRWQDPRGARSHTLNPEPVQAGAAVAFQDLQW